MKTTGGGHLHRRGKTWYLAFQAEGRRQKVRIVDGEGKAVTSKNDARRLADELLMPHRLTNAAERVGALAAKADTVKAAADALNPGLALVAAWSAYLSAGNRPDTGAATLAQYEYQWSRFTTWAKDAYPKATHLADVTPAMAQAFIAYLEKAELAPRTLNGYANLLHLLFRVLAEPGKVTVNPWGEQFITRRTLPTNTGRKELSVDVLRKVCESAQGELRTLFAVGLYCGLRLGDACRLAWEEVDLARGVLVVTPHKTARTSGTTVAIPLAPALRRVLGSLPGDQHGPIMPALAAQYESNSRAVVKAVQDHFAACGVKTGAIVPGRAHMRVLVGFHSLRHSFCSHAAAAGWPESLVRAVVGHTSAAVTRRYLHTSVIQAASLTQLPDVMSDAPAALPPAPADWRARFHATIDAAPTPADARAAVAALAE